jgi:chromosome segregation ATPase
MTLNSDLDQYQQRIDHQSTLIHNLHTERDQLNEQLTDAVKRSVADAVAAHALEHDLRARNRFAKSLLKKLGRHKADQRTVQAQLMDEKRQGRELRTANEWLSGEVAQLKSERNVLQQRLRRQAQQIDELNVAIAQKDEDNKRADAQFAQVGDDELGRLEVAKDLEKEIAKQSDEADQLREQISVMKIEQEKAIGSLRQVTSQMMDPVT